MAAVGVPLLGGIVLAARTTSLRVNTTDSMPRGLWHVSPFPGRIRRGMTVTVCLPKGAAARLALARNYVSPGPCASGTAPLLKPVAAVAGDVVHVSASGITVNSVPVPNSAALERDAAGRPLRPVSPGTYRVAPGHVWLLSHYNADSWDSRYLGPVSVTDIRGVARPVWVFR
ncbi:MAG: conjugative transfer signal peptidase TraF [Stellaceae bacterium]